MRGKNFGRKNWPCVKFWTVLRRHYRQKANEEVFGMKKWCAMLAGLMLCMLAAGGFAEAIGPGPAVLWADEQGGLVDMHETAEADSAVLMRYFDGTVCDVLAIDGGWARVRVGSEKIYLQGFRIKMK